jgi:hypothetical protein
MVQVLICYFLLDTKRDEGLSRLSLLLLTPNDEFGKSEFDRHK